MSTEKKRDRALQHRVRERQAKTGESYQAAWRSLTGGDAQVPWGSARRVPLSVGSSVKILPGQSAQFTAWPQLDAFWPDRLLIKNADHWVIERFLVRSWEDAPEAPLIETTSCHASAFSLDAWQPLIPQEVCCGQQIAVMVTYTGPNKQGECFEAALFGWEGQLPKKLPKKLPKQGEDGSERVSEQAESKSTAPNETVELPFFIKAPTLFVDHLTIQGAKDWVVQDVRTQGKSILVQAGELPGEMFSDSTPVILEPLTAGDRVEIVAAYIGDSPSARLVVVLSGTPSFSGASRAVSYFLPMSTGVPIPPSHSAEITSRPQKRFLPERLVIASPEDWIVNDITVGTRRQLAARGDIPGQSFASCTVGSHLTLDPVHAGQDFGITTTRGENCKEAWFLCGAQGRLVQAP